MKQIKLLMLLALAVFICGCAAEDDYSVVGSIYGTVTDADTGQPIQGASVTLTPTNTSTVTGSGGTFEFQNLASQQYSMTVTKSGYIYNSRQVTVTAGQSTSSDMVLTPEADITGFSLSSEVLAFGSNYSELTFVITNNSNSSATAWSITDIDVDWLSVSPSTGTTDMGQQSVVKVSIDRSYITESLTTYFIINAAGGSKQIMVTASKAEEGEGDASDTEDDLSVSTTALAFGENYDTLTFTISNSGVSDFDFSLWLVSQAWLKFGWSSSTVEAGGSQTVTVAIDRDLLYGEGEVTVEVRTDVGSKYITITAYEPITYGTVTTADRDLDAYITGVEMSGTTAYIDVVFVNNSTETYSIFYIGSYSAAGGVYMYALDSESNTYYHKNGDMSITVNGQSASSSGTVNVNFPGNGATLKGEIVVYNVDESATSFKTISLCTYAYNTTGFDGTTTVFSNVPIIR